MFESDQKKTKEKYNEVYHKHGMEPFIYVLRDFI